MSMWLVLVKIEPDLLEAVRADPQLLATILGEEEHPLPDGLSVAIDVEADHFGADYLTLSAIADVMPAKEWFDKATTGTESLDYDGFTYVPKDFKSPRDYNRLRNLLQKRYSDTLVEKFLSGNAERVLRTGWDSASL